MQKFSEQVELIGSWISSKDKWTKAHNTNGEPTPGSCGVNVIIGYLPTCNGNENEITVIYKCQLPISEDQNVENYQLSSLAFSDWVTFMKKIHG
ncbi:hypothetical protein [Lelliottia nimipressuralis]|uniref:hypothetical protein n=1 Tax=Lelliottia nimipressuralis TaxID=69220 RepID=UPI001E2A4157|nr:hypothetical protein [Lelliottia nimipressuralis]MCD4562311.1 hypothetical protein [Lelliottia nimipressuralis]